MIDMGFEAQVNAVLDAMPSATLKSEVEQEAEQQEAEQQALKAQGRVIYRTTIMFSATMPPAVERIARTYLRRPAYVYIGNAGKVVGTVTQNIVIIHGDDEKRRHALKILESAAPPVIVFVNKKKTCDTLSKSLEKLGYRCISLHSGRSQDQREIAMDGFKAGKYDILVATDVAGRGIDVHGVTHVINYDMPKSKSYPKDLLIFSAIEDYTHRVGRTGRMGMKGEATSFLNLTENAEILYRLFLFVCLLLQIRS